MARPAPWCDAIFHYGMKLIRVRVTAGARRESVKKRKEGVYEISVREEAKDNGANRRAVELVAMEFGLPAKAVRIARGHRKPSKLFRLAT